MRIARNGLRLCVALLAVTPFAADAQTPDDFCTELRRIVAAAEADPMLDSLAWEAGTPALGFSNCAVVGSMAPDGGPSSFGCSDSAADTSGRWAALNAEIQQCLPSAIPFRDRDFEETALRHYAFFRVGHVTIGTIEEGIGNRPGWSSSLTVERQTTG